MDTDKMGLKRVQHSSVEIFGFAKPTETRPVRLACCAWEVALISDVLGETVKLDQSLLCY